MLTMTSSLRRRIRCVARRLTRDARGQSVIEFAVALPFLVLMSVGAFAVGMVIDRHLTLGQVTRNGGNMFARGVSFRDSATQNKQLIVDAASGLGMTIDGGTAVMYMSLLQKIPADATCGGSPCENAGLVVIARRFKIGNTSIEDSKFGMPTNLASDGNHNDFFDDSDAQADNVPAALTTSMEDNEILYAVEVYHEPDSLAFQGIFAPELMYSRAFF
jgi:hypothetical protein